MILKNSRFFPVFTGITLLLSTSASSEFLLHVMADQSCPVHSFQSMASYLLIPTPGSSTCASRIHSSGTSPGYLRPLSRQSTEPNNPCPVQKAGLAGLKWRDTLHTSRDTIFSWIFVVKQPIFGIIRTLVDGDPRHKRQEWGP